MNDLIKEAFSGKRALNREEFSVYFQKNTPLVYTYKLSLGTLLGIDFDEELNILPDNCQFMQHKQELEQLQVQNQSLNTFVEEGSDFAYEEPVNDIFAYSQVFQTQQFGMQGELSSETFENLEASWQFKVTRNNQNNVGLTLICLRTRGIIHVVFTFEFQDSKSGQLIKKKSLFVSFAPDKKQMSIPPIIAFAQLPKPRFKVRLSRIKQPPVEEIKPGSFKVAFPPMERFDTIKTS